MTDKDIAPLEGGAITIRSGAATPPQILELWIADQNSDRTAKSYRDAFASFARFINESPDGAATILLQMATPQANTAITLYRAEMEDDGKAPNTIKHRVTALRSFCEFAVYLGHDAPRISLRRLKAERVRPQPEFSEEQVMQTLKLAQSRTNPLLRARDFALFLMLFTTALRRSEVASLRVCDVDFENLAIRPIRKGHGSERRAVEISEPLAKAIGEWLSISDRWDMPQATLFRNLHRGPRSEWAEFSDKTVYNICARYFAELSIKASGAHAWRKRSFTSLMDRGVPPLKVKDFADWADLRMHETYDLERRRRHSGLTSTLAEIAMSDGESETSSK